MTVRNTTKTTLSVIALITGFIFFKKYYIVFLSRIMQKILHINEYAPIILGRLFPNSYIGGYYTGLFYFSVTVIIAALMLYAVLEQKTGLTILSPYISPLILTGIVSIALCIYKLNLLQLWGIFYFCLLICLHSTFKKIILNSESVGSYADLKLIKGFVLTVKNAVSKAVSTGIRNFNNPVDEAFILCTSAIVLLLELMVLISFIVYMSMHWRIIFLSHLIS